MFVRIFCTSPDLIHWNLMSPGEAKANIAVEMRADDLYGWLVWRQPVIRRRFGCWSIDTPRREAVAIRPMPATSPATTVLEHDETVYDADANPIETLQRNRFNTDTGTNALGGPTDTNAARVLLHRQLLRCPPIALRPVST